ncbi:signal peptidase I [Glutamicibacter sp.]|uniref:signal peptidase I n=1 Tax=Glutamicibacter sp. TaxID=1931995 RepID=UPI0028BF557F|nr:signal peptidase I [Glutamicibacter sp.]
MNTSTRRQHHGKRAKTGVFWWIGQIVSWLALFVVVLLIAVMIVVPKIGGAATYTVLTGSMRPTYPPGEFIVVKPVPFDQIQSGDVVTYQLESGKPAVVTHRVVGIDVKVDGSKRLIARGDANNVDDAPVQSEQVRGRLWYSLPWLGYLNSALTGQQRTWLTWTAVIGLSAYSLVMFTGAIRDRRKQVKS